MAQDLPAAGIVRQQISLNIMSAHTVAATIIIGVLLTLSGTLVISTVFPAVNVSVTAIVVAVALLGGGGGAGLFLEVRHRRGSDPRPAPVRMSAEERTNWRMPPLALLKPVVWSPGTRLGMAMLRGYLVVSVLLLIIKAIRLGGA